MTRPFTGWHFTAIICAFFGVVIAVNMTMAVLATRTFGGVVVENSYVASQKYNQWLAAARDQQRLGWHVAPSVDAQRHVTVAPAPQGITASGVAEHPLGQADDVNLSFVRDGKLLRSREALPEGRWKVRLVLRKGGEEVRVVETLS